MLASRYCKPIAQLLLFKRNGAHFATSKKIITPRAPSLEHKYDMDMYTGPKTENANKSPIRQNSTSCDEKIISNYKAESVFRSAQKNIEKFSFNNPYLSVP